MSTYNEIKAEFFIVWCLLCECLMVQEGMNQTQTIIQASPLEPHFKTLHFTGHTVLILYLPRLLPPHQEHSRKHLVFIMDSSMIEICFRETSVSPKTQLMSLSLTLITVFTDGKRIALKSRGPCLGHMCHDWTSSEKAAFSSY